ncbi:MAG: tetratricopeptide repeat protein [Phycisphaerae bacterium]|nr:tetratricopeptide repeat protein [Phycisphaerae bacterium]
MRLIEPEEVDRARRMAQALERLLEIGDCYAAMENFVRAEQYYHQAAVMVPDHPGPYIGLGVIALQAGEGEKALRAFKIAADIAPDCAEAYNGMGMIHHEHRRYPQAFEMYLKCLEINSDNLIALLGLFQTACRMGTFSKIIYYLEAYLKQHPEDNSVLFCLATLYAREGMDIQAKAALLTVLAGEPDKPEAVELLQKVEENLASREKREVA